jgi:biotin carboxyl carrier protein
MARVTDPGGVRVTVQASLAVPEAVSVVVERTARATLRWLDSERAALEGSDAGPGGRGPRQAIRVLLLPPLRSSGGAVRREVIVDGWRFELEVEPAARVALRDRARRGREAATHSGPTEVHAMIPGVVVSVAVVPGETVVAGQQLLAIEAMKMQNELRAPRGGIVERLAVAPGQRIDVGDLLLVISQVGA